MGTLFNGFSRNEVSELSGLAIHKLSYLDRAEIITPERILPPGSKRNLLAYSWLQVLECRAVARLREDISLQSLRKVIEFLEQNFNDSRLGNKNIIVINDEVFWMNPDFSDMPEIMLALSKDPGQLTHSEFFIIPNIKSEVFEIAEKSNVIDYESFKERATMSQVA